MADIFVLLVSEEDDDYLFIQNLLSDVQGENFHIHWARSYEAGLQALDQENFDIVLVDYKLRFHTGAQFVQTSAMHVYHVPFILFTKDEGWTSHEDAFACSAGRCMVKHEMTPESLKEAILQEVNWEKVRTRFNF